MQEAYAGWRHRLGAPDPPHRRWRASCRSRGACAEHGIPQFPDPRTSVPSNPFGSGSGYGVISDIEGVILVFPSTIDEQSPAFTHAAAACAFPLHNH